VRIFFVAQRVPYPPNRGDKICTFNEIRHLSADHEVHVYCLADGDSDLANVGGLARYAARVTAVPVGALRSRLRAALRLAGRKSLSVEAFNEPELHAAIKSGVTALKPDAIIVYSSNVAQYAEPFSEVARIMQFCDLDSLKWQQYANRSSWPMRAVYRSEWQRLLAYERRIAHSFDHSLVCTEIERRDFEALIPGAAVSTVGNGVDLEYFRPMGTRKKRFSLVFTGVMDYRPNIDAVTWFCEEMLPRIQAAVPEATFTICGSKPTSAVQKLASRPGVVVTGFVPDTRTYLDSADVFVAPLRIARGIQNKVLEAMAMGVPVVACTAAWRGTVFPQGGGILVADDAAEFAKCVIRLLLNQPERDDMARLARHNAERFYRWDTQMALLDEVLAGVVARRRGQVKDLE
jgi:polysaccharide biosynthesis protein PslH